MRIRQIAASLALALPVITGAATAQTQVVTYEVAAINDISFAGSPSLTINALNPGTVSDVSATYTILTNGTAMKITGSIASAMPAGLTLSVNLAAPGAGTSLGLTELTGTGAQDLVTGLSNVDASAIGVEYRLDAPATHSPVTSATKTVTYTVVQGS
jgi:hypothetical protein